MSSALVVRTLAELEAAVGVELGPGPWLTVSSSRIARFVEATGSADFLAVSLISGLAPDLYAFELGSARLNYGLDRVRFLAPLSAGSRVRLRCTIADVERRNGSALVPIDFVVEVEGASEPACEARKMSLILL